MSHDLLYIRDDLVFPKQGLSMFLPDIETALFFGQLYELTAHELSVLLIELFQTDLISALLQGSHSEELQHYIVDELNIPDVEHVFDPGNEHIVPQLLPQMWDQIRVDVAKSIKDVATKLGTTVQSMPGIQGQMLFKSMMTMNRKRPVVGDYKAYVNHAHTAPNLVVLDTSGSVSPGTVQAIVGEVVALAYQANAHLAVVSTHSYHWNPGAFSTSSVLQHAQYSGTCYETLAPLMARDWGTVVTIADYDSSISAKQHLAKCKGSIDQVLDISLVREPTFLGECLGQLSPNPVRPILIASNDAVLLR